MHQMERVASSTDFVTASNTIVVVVDTNNISNKIEPSDQIPRLKKGNKHDNFKMLYANNPVRSRPYSRFRTV